MANAKKPQEPRVPPPPPLFLTAGRNMPGAGAGLGGAYAPAAAYGPDSPGANAAGFGGKEGALGGGGSGGGGGGSSPSGADIDWATVYFGQWNLPSDLIGQIESLGKQYGTTNPDVFYNAALNAVRGSDWFKVTYPGFNSGVTAGLFTDETGYRGYVNNLNNIYQQYLNRHVSGDETAAALAQGATPDLIGRQFQGDAIANVNASQWQYLTGAFDENGQLSSAERTAFGREQAGIDTPLGQMVQKRVQQATARASALFGGTLATPSMSVANGRLTAPSLGASQTPDIAA